MSLAYVANKTENINLKYNLYSFIQRYGKKISN